MIDSKNSCVLIKKSIDVSHIYKYLTNVKYIHSSYYDAKTDKTIVDDKVRKSTKCNIDNKELNTIIEKLLKHNGYLFVPVNLELIKYEPGDFFIRHTDYSLGRNDSTFLLCISSSKKGGETIVGLNLYKQDVGDLLVFDKKLEHEGCKVLNGTKIVLKGNCIRLTKPDFMVINVVHSKYYYIVDAGTICDIGLSYSVIWKNHKLKNPDVIGYLYNELYKSKDLVKHLIEPDGNSTLGLAMQIILLGAPIGSPSLQVEREQIEYRERGLEDTSFRERELMDSGFDSDRSESSDHDLGLSLFD